jgi:uncharacterized protein (TIGR00661 family)
MNILYGLCGEGVGHATRALSLVPFLQSKGHKVLLLADEDAYNFLKGKFNIVKIRGMRFVIEKNNLNKVKTLFHNLKNYPKNLFDYNKFVKIKDKFKPDILITDFHPIMFILSKAYNLPLISIDNINGINFTKVSIKDRHFTDFMLAKLVVKIIVPSADRYIITSFKNLKVKSKKVVIVPPIIRKDVRALSPQNGASILVYPRKTEKVLDYLKNINEKFLVFGTQKTSGKSGNMEFRDNKTFLKEIRRCKAIIATAGFSLISEALFLKKPYFAVPQPGQFEQFFNSISLKHSGFGDYSELNDLSEKKIKDFLSNSEEYKKNLKKYSPDYDLVFKELDKAVNELKKK